MAAENALYRCDATAFKQILHNCKGWGDSPGGGGGGAMSTFTFLRLCDSLMEEGNLAEFAAFVKSMNGEDEEFNTY